MKITVFASRKHTSDGKPFTVYSTKLFNKSTNKKDYVNVRFVGELELKKENCPCIIEFDKKDGNISKRAFLDKEGNTREGLTLWIKNYHMSSEEFVDHSLDDYC